MSQFASLFTKVMTVIIVAALMLFFVLPPLFSAPSNIANLFGGTLLVGMIILSLYFLTKPIYNFYINKSKDKI